jgi:hypothetical protein
MVMIIAVVVIMVIIMSEVNSSICSNHGISRQAYTSMSPNARERREKNRVSRETRPAWSFCAVGMYDMIGIDE